MLKIILGIFNIFSFYNLDMVTFMTRLNDARLIGGIGSLFYLASFFTGFHFTGSILLLIGLVLIGVAVKYISDETKDSTIFNNFMYFILITIIGSIVAIILGLGTFLLGAITIRRMFFSAILTFIVALIIVWVTFTIASTYLRRSFEQIKEKTNVNLFSTAGKFYFWGALLTIILVGFIILLIGIIFMVVAFFSLPDKLPEQAQTPMQQV
ncbi:MAG: hypothetical protein C0177_03110 [Fervidicoccus fontis]|uniref:DUF996 domain-containing protein n=2 Tax=Fervidicoccus fontis TaxID=683846 RepID=A0A2J6N3V3_9CREN|nr:MAG: hypothetical protein C0188_00985 [Fervidicoccus fontis]PMB77382.1 MAG: hypothetical protein C0177_03110 [Fervidicoccus fontis]HEW63445.1 DUF996 domain-containing protein [Fervidicoccus fontis]